MPQRKLLTKLTHNDLVELRKYCQSNYGNKEYGFIEYVSLDQSERPYFGVLVVKGERATQLIGYSLEEIKNVVGAYFEGVGLS